MTTTHERLRPVTTPEELEAALGPALEAVRAAYGTDVDSPASTAATDAATDAKDDLVVVDRLFDTLRPLRFGSVAIVEPRVVALATDPRWEVRALVAEVLRYLTGPHDPLRTRGQRRLGEPAIARAWLLCAMANVERDARVLHAIVCAFIDLKHEVGDDAAAAFACRFVEHDDPDVRRSAVGVLNANRGGAAIAALIARTRDPDPGVREWACFGLGHQLGDPRGGDIIDTLEIREALAACVADPVGAVCQDAATGLAIRGDERGLTAIGECLARFEAEDVTEGVLDAVKTAPRSRFVPRLAVIAAAQPDRESAADALKACRAAGTW